MTQMKSVGETMAIGSTFKESFQKALRGLEVGAFGFGSDGNDLWAHNKENSDEQPDESTIKEKLSRPCPERIWYLRYAMKSGMSVDQIFDLTKIDRWFSTICRKSSKPKNASARSASSTTFRLS